MKAHDSKLDALRGLSALVVLAGHGVQVLWPQAPAWLIALSGNAARHAVLVFFLLSGFLISRSIVANVRRHGGAFGLADYLTARATRIYPPLLGAIAVVGLVGAIIHGFDLPSAFGDGQARGVFTVDPGEMVKALLFMDGGLANEDGPLWTLYVEVHLYLVAGVVALAWTQRSALWTAAGAVLLAYYLNSLVEFALFAGVWGLGAVAAVFPAQMRAVRWLGALSALALVGIGIADPALLDFRHATLGGPVQLLFALAYLAAFILSGPWRVPAWTKATADFSYTLYVVHFPLLLLALSLTLGKVAGGVPLVVAACVACVVVAAILARFVEDQGRFRPAIARALGAKPLAPSRAVDVGARMASER